MSSSSDYFALFDMEPTFLIDLNVLKQQWISLQQTHHPDKNIHASGDERKHVVATSAEINAGYQTLQNPIERAKHLLILAGHDFTQDKTPLSQAVLMQHMQLSEQVEDGEDIANTLTEGITQSYRDFDTAWLSKDYANASRSLQIMIFYTQLKARSRHAGN